MKIYLLGVDHRVQELDPTGDLKRILNELITTYPIDLIAEEASESRATVTQTLGKLRVNVDMSKAERDQGGIQDELDNRGWSFIHEGDYVVGETRDYLPHADFMRETHWIGRLFEHPAKYAIVLCGLLHMSPLAQKLRNRGCEVEELNLCESGWCTRYFGRWRILEKDGVRSSELRYPRGQERPIYGG